MIDLDRLSQLDKEIDDLLDSVSDDYLLKWLDRQSQDNLNSYVGEGVYCTKEMPPTRYTVSVFFPPDCIECPNFNPGEFSYNKAA